MSNITKITMDTLDEVPLFNPKKIDVKSVCFFYVCLLTSFFVTFYFISTDFQFYLNNLVLH